MRKSKSTAGLVGRFYFGLSSRYGSFFGMLWRDKIAFLAALVLLIVIFCAIAAPVIMPHSPTEQDLYNRLAPPFWSPEGDLTHPLGTDQLGRDLLSRIINATRISLLVGVSIVIISAVIGITLGILGGFCRGKIDEVIMSVTDVFMAFPGLVLIMAIARMMGPGLETIIIVMSVRFWVSFARLSRGLVMSVRETEYMTAAKAIGCSTRRLLVSCALPNILSPIITLAILECAHVMLAEAGVSFLGFGIQPPMSSWGLMIAEGRDYLGSAWWVVTFPGLALSITILAMNILASYMRLVTDPVQRVKLQAVAAKE